VAFNSTIFSPDLFNPSNFLFSPSIPFNLIQYYTYTIYRTGQNKNLLHGQIQLLQWWWWRQNELTVKSRWWWSLNSCCCWRWEREGVKTGSAAGDRCRHAAINEDWRGSLKSWAVEEIVVAVKIATVKIGSWALRKKKAWRLDRDHFCGEWRSSPLLLWLPTCRCPVG